MHRRYTFSGREEGLELWDHAVVDKCVCFTERIDYSPIAGASSRFVQSYIDGELGFKIRMRIFADGRGGDYLVVAQATNDNVLLDQGALGGVRPTEKGVPRLLDQEKRSPVLVIVPEAVKGRKWIRSAIWMKRP